MKPLNDHWLILRTSSRNTLRLCEQLIREGFDAWAPKRTFAKKGKSGMLTVTAPLLPSFAFARAEHVHSLLALENDPVKPCADFSVFRDDMFPDGVPLILDSELHPLRAREEWEKRMMRRRKPKVRVFRPGETVRIEEGAFAGMSGSVKRDDGKFATVLFGNREVKISTFILVGEQIVCEPNTVLSAAA